MGSILPDISLPSGLQQRLESLAILFGVDEQLAELLIDIKHNRGGETFVDMAYPVVVAEHETNV